MVYFINIWFERKIYNFFWNSNLVLCGITCWLQYFKSSYLLTTSHQYLCLQLSDLISFQLILNWWKFRSLVVNFVENNTIISLLCTAIWDSNVTQRETFLVKFARQALKEKITSYVTTNLFISWISINEPPSKVTMLEPETNEEIN